MVAEFGFDYGVRPRLMLVSDFSFGEYFDKADCQGVVYLHPREPDGSSLPEEFGWQFLHEQYAKQFLEVLLGWVRNSGNNGDAVELEFIERNDGEYIVAVRPDFEIFINRMLNPVLKDRIEPLATIYTQGKGGMTIGENFERFKNGYIKGRKVVIRYFIPSPSGGYKLSERYFLKTVFKFLKESELSKNDQAAALLTTKNKSFKPPKPQKVTDALLGKVADRRTEELKFFYPITWDKLNRAGWLVDIVSALPGHLTKLDIFQAVCNLVLLERLKQDCPEWLKTSGPGYGVNILRYLSENAETFDTYTPPDSIFTKSSIKKQVKRDKTYLADHLSK